MYDSEVLVDIGREGLRDFFENADRNFADLRVGVDAPTLFEELSPGTMVTRYYDVGFRHVGEYAARSLSRLLPAYCSILRARELLLSQLNKSLVCPLRSFVHLFQDFEGVWVISKQRRNDDGEFLFVHESLAELGEREMSVSYQLMAAASRYSGEDDGESCVLQDTEVFLLNDVLEVLLVGSSAWVGPGLIAESTSKFAQDLRVLRGVCLPHSPRCSFPLVQGEHCVSCFPDSQGGDFHDHNSTKREGSR